MVLIKDDLKDVSSQRCILIEEKKTSNYFELGMVVILLTGQMASCIFTCSTEFTWLLYPNM